jgi:L-asparaginase/Glu-tRNA(Gln) amidotransferase subunit D
MCWRAQAAVESAVTLALNRFGCQARRAAAAPLRGVVVGGEGKGPEEKSGSDDFQEGDRKGTTVIVSKRVKTMSKPR